MKKVSLVIIVYMIVTIPLLKAKQIDERDNITISDENLRTCITKQNGVAHSALTNEDIESLTSLSCENSNISDISGLEKATNLKYLDLSGNNISNISSLKDLINLDTLVLAQNRIIDISGLEQLTNLTRLELQDNEIINIEALSNLSNLQYLKLYNNQIKDISSLSKLEELRQLLIDNNNITSLEPLSKLTKLVILGANDNQISNLEDISFLKNLQTLNLNNNQINDISPIAELVNLKQLNISSNNISDLTAISGLNSLESIDISNNHLSDLSVLANKKLSINAMNQQIYLDPRTVINSNQVKHTVVDFNGKKHNIIMEVTKAGENKLSDSITYIESGQKRYSVVVYQTINYEPPNPITINSHEKVTEEIYLSDSQLISIFDVKSVYKQTISVDQSNVNYKVPGKYNVIFSDENNNQIVGKLEVIDEKPVISATSNCIVWPVGLKVTDLKSIFGINGTEIIKGDLTNSIAVDDSQVDYNHTGSYKVKFTVIDQEGNTAKLSTKLVLKSFDDSSGIYFDQDGVKFKIRKLDAYSQGIPGYEYTIYDQDGNIVDVILTDENGYAESISLKKGTYFIKETNVPDGEKITSSSYKVEVDSGRKLVQITDNDQEHDNGLGNQQNEETEKQNPKKPEKKSSENKTSIKHDEIHGEKQAKSVSLFFLTVSGIIVIIVIVLKYKLIKVRK